MESHEEAALRVCMVTPGSLPREGKKWHGKSTPRILIAEGEGAKLIVPNSTAGLIIGKGGATVKAVMEQSGAWVQLSQKPEGINLQERVVTVSGEAEQNRKAVELIVQKIQEDPQSGSCLNISYANISGPVANSNPTGSPYANSTEVLPAAAAAAAAASAAGLLGHANLAGVAGFAGGGGGGGGGAAG
eukprot:g41617.t1